MLNMIKRFGFILHLLAMKMTNMLVGTLKQIHGQLVILAELLELMQGVFHNLFMQLLKITIIIFPEDDFRF